MSPSKVSQRLTEPSLVTGRRGIVALGLRRLRWALQKHGPAGAAKRLGRLLLMLHWRRQNRQDYQKWLALTGEQDSDFDQTYGVDTSGIVRLRELAVVGQHWT